MGDRRRKGYAPAPVERHAGPAQVMQLSDTAKGCWEQLQITYGDTERILAHDALVELIEINPENFTSVESFTIGFRSAVTRLDTLGETLLPIHVVCFFIFAAEKGYPIWAERQHSFLRRQKEAPKIDDLIAISFLLSAIPIDISKTTSLTVRRPRCVLDPLGNESLQDGDLQTTITEIQRRAEDRRRQADSETINISSFPCHSSVPSLGTCNTVFRRPRLNLNLTAEGIFVRPS
jgi:hypothetical protein